MSPYWLCWESVTDTLSDETADPVLYAQIQFEAESVKDIEPPDQLLQFEPASCQLVGIYPLGHVYLHLTLAVITPFSIPEPSRRVTSAVVSEFGSWFPVPSRGDSVTLVPVESAYIMKIFAPFIDDPWPRPIQDSVVDGPLSWK